MTLHTSQLRRAAEAARADAAERFGAAITILEQVRGELNALGCDELADMVSDIIGTARYELEGAIEYAEADAADAYGDFRRDMDGDR